MRLTLLVSAIFLTTLMISGCGNFEERAFNVENGAILRDGILRDGLNVKVEPGAVLVKEGAFQGPAFKVEPNAVHLEVATGAVQFHENSININLTGKRKGPWIDTEEVKKQLKEGLGQVGALEGLTEVERNRIVQNEVIYQTVIKALLQAIDKYNIEFAEPPKVEE